MEFINRRHEIEHLNNEYNSEGAKFVIIYGRRRIGKTRLIEEFIKDKEAVYYLASQETEKQQIEEFKRIIANKLNDEFLENAKFEGWKELFSYLERVWPKDKRVILSIDEITYIIKTNSSFPSYFQKFWDRFLCKTKTFVIFTGSLVSLIIESILSHDSPLYGRRTSQIHLTPFSFKESRLFMKNIPFEEQIKFYCIVGGVAKYLLFIDKKEETEHFIKEKFLSREGFFYSEGIFLFSQEFKDPSTYLDVIKAITFGNSKIGEIANFVGIESKKISRYLDILINLGFVKKVIPVDANKKKFRGAVYEIEDNFLKFWNRFIYPNRNLIELRNKDGTMDKINQNINAFIGRGFEIVCHEVFNELINEKKVSYDGVGRWWGSYRDKNERKTVEIDLVALNSDKKEILFGECKWKENVDAQKIIDELKEKAEFVKWNNGKRKDYYCIFAKSFKKRMHDENILLFDLKDMKKILEEPR